MTALGRDGAVVLQAPPGAGKTTSVPLALLGADWLAGGRIIMLEPRRLAARAAANRMAELLNEKAGQTVGYHIRGEHCSSAATRILVVTEGVLTRMLQSDPALESFAVVIFDEYHERSLHADTSLAFCLQSREVLREDLKLLVMSATLDTTAVAAVLGDGTPVLQSEGRSYPVETRYAGAANDAPLDTRNLGATVARQIIEVLQQETGSILVFLPGAGEIRRTIDELQNHFSNDALRESADSVVIAPLYGELSRRQQDEAVAPAPDGKRKVVLSTNIAETSVTIEGIRIVIDSGLMRETRFNPGRGMNRLETVFISEDSADQRRGRAGRLEPGICLRLWSANRQLEKQRRAEILNSDLSQLALELAQWGVADVTELKWIDIPPASSLAQARDVLLATGAIDTEYVITTHGSDMLALGVEPRLANMIIRAAAHGELKRACQLAALLSERDFIRRGQSRSHSRSQGHSQNYSNSDLAMRLELLESGPAGQAADSSIVKRVKASAKQFEQRYSKRTDRNIGNSTGTNNGQTSRQSIPVAVLLAFAYPERIAKARGTSAALEQMFLLANGRGARLSCEDPLSQSDYLVVADLDGGQRDAKIYRAAALAEDDLAYWLADSIQVTEVVRWDQQVNRVVARRDRKFGAITLDSKPIDKPDQTAVQQGLMEGIRDVGIKALALSPACEQWIARLNFIKSVAAENAGHPLAVMA
ncbi:ATP-dependent helicase HrpB, partial [Chromatiales bacterium (ex Bugula neritina AB1)]